MGVIKGIERLGNRAITLISEIGAMILLLFQVLAWCVRPPFRPSLTLRQMEFVGAGSFFIVLLTGSFTGMVLALQLAEGFGRFDAENLVGSTIAIALCRELGPVLTGLIVTGRVASAMATELGTMRVTEQIDALHTMAVSPVQYLIVPRVLAGVTMVPVLTMFFNCVGLMSAYWISVEMLGIDPGAFMRYVRNYLRPEDVTIGIVKSVLFGVCISLVACHKGFNASGGAKGVGQATTDAVVFNFIAIFFVDYIVTVLAFG